MRVCYCSSVGEGESCLQRVAGKLCDTCSRGLFGLPRLRPCWDVGAGEASTECLDDVFFLTNILCRTIGFYNKLFRPYQILIVSKLT